LLGRNIECVREVLVQRLKGGHDLLRSPDFECSIATVRPSIQPSALSLCTNASNHGPCAARVPGISNPMVGSLRGRLRASDQRPSRRTAC
jgi:hypothetical protein